MFSDFIETTPDSNHEWIFCVNDWQSVFSLVRDCCEITESAPDPALLKLRFVLDIEKNSQDDGKEKKQ